MLQFIDFLKLQPARITRLRYLALVIFWSLVMLVAMSIKLFDLDTNFIRGNPDRDLILSMILIIIVITAIANIIFLKIRRMHDFDYRGWWLLLLFIPFVNFIITLVIIFTPGTKGPNRFGKAPGN